MGFREGNMKRLSKFKLLLVVVVALIVISSTMLIGCTPFKAAPQGISEDTREFTKIKDKRMYAEAKDYKGYIYKNGDEAFCFRFKSPNIEENKVYPLVIFLHGLGDFGSNNSSHMYRSLIDGVAQNAPEECFVFMPQGVKNYDWTDTGILTGKGGMDKLYNECLDLLLENYPIDKARVYLTGMSMGGQGTVWQATQHPEKYAGIIPLCGWYYLKGVDEMKLKNLENIVDKPMKFFHSRNDNAVDFECSKKVVEKLKSLGATNIEFIEFDEPLHDITPLVYCEKELWQWLFSQKL